MKIFDRLGALDTLPMHMPGHKRNADRFPWLRGMAERDITEIRGFDDLNDPEDGFLEMERTAARLWGASETVALVGGSTLGVLASVLSALEGGGELLMCRASHRSVYHAAQLLGARTRYLTPPPDRETGVPLSADPAQVSECLDHWPEVRLVCVTSPTYEGVLSHIPAIARECHRRGVPLLVDEAHGAHLGLPGFPEGAVAGGADLVVQSLHKTLPALTQTALLHISGSLVDPARVRRYAGMLQTSSPSYLLSASVEKCLEYLENHGAEAAEAWATLLSDFEGRAGELRNIRLWRGMEGVFARDPSKLLLIAGEGLGDRLREEYRIEPEYARGSLTLCMTGMGDTEASLGHLCEALRDLDRRMMPREPEEHVPAPLPKQALTLREAMTLPGELVPAERALGRIAGEYAWVYPPGVPCLVPGEEVDAGVLEMLRRARDLRFTHKHGPESIFCVDLPGKMV